MTSDSQAIDLSKWYGIYHTLSSFVYFRASHNHFTVSRLGNVEAANLNANAFATNLLYLTFRHDRYINLSYSHYSCYVLNIISNESCTYCIMYSHRAILRYVINVITTVSMLSPQPAFEIAPDELFEVHYRLEDYEFFRGTARFTATEVRGPVVRHIRLGCSNRNQSKG